MDESGIKQIVILQRGWVIIGDFYKSGSDCETRNTYVIRRWGTEYGLGQIAEHGPTDRTILDPVGTMHFHELTTVGRIDVNSDKWK